MTNKINTVLKAITDQITGTLPSDTVKNPKLGTHPVWSARSYPIMDPQCLTQIHSSINTISQVEPPRPEEPKPSLKEEFKDLHLNLPVIEVLAHAPIYNAILDKYIRGLIAFQHLADLGSCVNIIPLYLFKKLNIGLLEETDHIFGLADGTKSYPVGIVRDVEEISRDAELNPFKDTLVFRRMVEFLGAIPINLKCNMWESEDLVENKIDWNKPPKNGDGAWHVKIRIINPDEEEFTKTLQLIPTTRKLSERENPKEIIDLDHFYDT
ncbi:hypothetical protein Tco_1039091 [Tanacetum coccineum]